MKYIGLFLVLLLGNYVISQSIRSNNVRAFYEESCPHCSNKDMGSFSDAKEIKLYKVYHSLHQKLEKMDVYGATQSLRECLHLNEEINNESIAVKLELMRGTLFDIFGLPTEELIHTQKAQTKSLSKSKWQEYLTSNLATTYLDMHEYSTAYNMLCEWRASISDSTPRDILKTNYYNLGQCYSQLNKLDSAMIFQRKSLELELLDKDTSGLVSSYMEIGNVLYLQYQDDSARVYFKKAYDLAKKIYDIDLMKFTTLNMSIVEEGAGNTELALNYRKEYDGIRDSLDSRDRLWTIAKEEKDFAVSLKEKEIALIEKEKTIKTEQLQAQKRERNLYLVATIALVLLLGVILILFKRSVTKKRIIEEQRLTLESLNATKDRILSIVAHDLKSPVYHIVLNNKDLLNHLNENSDLEKHKKLFESNIELGNRTYQLIDNLLNWALCQNDQFFFSKAMIPLKKTVEQVVYNFQPIFAQKNIQFHTDLDDETKVFMDQNSLKIVLRNLLDNAIKYTPEGGQIFISSVEGEKNFTKLTVSDSGIGMSPETIENSLNQKIGQSKADTSGKSSTGLGLNLCSSILEKNDCRIEIESKLEEGTTITLTLNKNGKN